MSADVVVRLRDEDITAVGSHLLKGGGRHRGMRSGGVDGVDLGGLGASARASDRFSGGSVTESAGY